MKPNFFILNLLQSLSLAGVIYVNYLANSLPINGMTTGELSGLYPNYFVPAGITFAIWGIIYLLLLLYVVRSWFGESSGGGEVDATRYLWFMVSGAGNAGWIFAWHYQRIWLSLALMLLLLYSLIRLYLSTRTSPWPLRVPVSIYLSWITVATIANATALLVALGWKGGIVGEPAWAIMMMTVAVALSSLIRLRFRDPFITLVVIWALLGIYLKFRVSDLPLSDVMQAAAIILMGVSILVMVIPALMRRRIVNG